MTVPPEPARGKETSCGVQILFRAKLTNYPGMVYYEVHIVFAPGPLRTHATGRNSPYFSKRGHFGSSIHRPNAAGIEYRGPLNGLPDEQSRDKSTMYTIWHHKNDEKFTILG